MEFAFINQRNTRSTRRSSRGQGLTELVAALIIIIPVALLVIDCVVLSIGVAVNDSICRDAARAAASGPPGDMSVGNGRTVPSGSPPHKRAVAVIKKVWGINMPLKVREDAKIIETINDVPPTQLGGAVGGVVSVETTVDVYPPFIVSAFVGSGGLAFRSRHEVAYTYVVPRPPAT